MAYSYKGAISFGLVYIPITFSVSVKNNDIGFNMLDKRTMSRIKYKKTCIDCDNREVPTEDIVKGFQYQKGKYVVFDQKEFDKIKSPKEKSIIIEQFVSLSEIDPIYFDRTYYVNPIGGEKAFAVLLKAMENEKKAGVAQSVIGTKDTLIMLRVNNGVMLASTLFFNDEIQSAPSYKKVVTVKKEVDLAKSLIAQMTEKFKPEKFKDEYNLKIKKAIKAKIAGKQIVQPKSKEKNVDVVNLMEALKKSLKNEGMRPRA